MAPLRGRKLLLCAFLLLVLLTGIVIVRRNRVGVRVVAFSPERGATSVSSRVAVRVTFDQEEATRAVWWRVASSQPGCLDRGSTL